jgi:DNA-binding NarL/FixJ family response regulator
MPSHSVLLVDDNLLLIELFKCYATGSGDIDLCCACSMEDALDLIDEKNPAVIFLDNRLTPYKNFKETVPLLRRRGFSGKIIVISSDVSDAIFKDCGSHTVSGCIDKFDLNYNNFNKVVKRVLS